MAGCVAACHHSRHILCCKVGIKLFCTFTWYRTWNGSKKLNDRRTVCAGNKCHSFRNATDIISLHVAGRATDIVREGAAYCTYTLCNKNQAAWNCQSPEPEVTCGTVAIIIRFVLYFPHTCAFVAFLWLPFITVNHAEYILTKDTNTFAWFEVKVN